MYPLSRNGNRTSQMAEYADAGVGNRLRQAAAWGTPGSPWATHLYDFNGNLEKKSKGTSAETWRYVYDNRNQITSATRSATDVGAATLLATYVYDAFGLRVEKQVDLDGAGTVHQPVKTRFAYDGDTIWADLNADDSLKLRYLHGDAVDELFARIAPDGTAKWYLTDRLGSVRDILDNTAGTVDTNENLEYDGYGAKKNTTGSPLLDRMRFTGREWDIETGLQYHRGRFYDPETGRWTSEDPSHFRAGDPNLYRYASNNTTGFVDRAGLESEPVGSHAGAGVQGAVAGNDDKDRESYLAKRFLQRYQEGGFYGIFGINSRETGDFLAGIGPGFLKQLEDNWEGLKELAKLANLIDPIANLGRGVKYFFTGELFTQEEMALIQGAERGFTFVKNLSSIYAGGVGRFALRMIAPGYSPLVKRSPDVDAFFRLIRPLMVELAIATIDMPAKTKGELVGRVLAEVVITFATAGVAKVATSGAAVRAVTRLKSLTIFKNNPRLVKALDKLFEAIQQYGKTNKLSAADEVTDEEVIRGILSQPTHYGGRQGVQKGRVVGRLGKVYQVEGRGPARTVDVTVEGWARVPLGEPVGGVYVVRNKATGELLKVGKTDNWHTRFREYRSWHLQEKLEIEIDFYAVEAKTLGHRRTVENELRKFLRSEGHDLPRDLEKRK